LTVGGNKANLITRIQEHDKRQTLEAVSTRDPPVPAGAQVRYNSSAAASTTTSGSEASGPVPGIPLAAQPTADLSATAFTNVNLPDLSQPDPEWPTPIPFYPDFYDSIHHPTPYKTAPEIADSGLPKVVVVAGSATHHGGALRTMLTMVPSLPKDTSMQICRLALLRPKHPPRLLLPASGRMWRLISVYLPIGNRI